MSKYELQKLFFKKSKKLLMTSFFRSRSRSWSRTLPVSVSKPKLRSRPVLVSVLVSEKFRGLGLGLGLGRVGLDYSPGKCIRLTVKLILVKFAVLNLTYFKYAIALVKTILFFFVRRITVRLFIANLITSFG